ncbi:hypothetical protein IQ07DRAFT_590525 [Pyrenochaeta sp. DS3sAY3a]|nr:hypothetical protein IQ07DRAFT_590525 [Pyrenochaeta sp. DS3sAY3a]
MDSFWKGYIKAEDEYHESCSHPKLPVDNILIEIDLTGERPTSIVPLPNTLLAQRPDTARIFLCSTSAKAQLVFRRLGMQDSVDYVQKVRDSDNDKATAFQVDGRQTLVPYDPRQLHKWLSIQPGQTATLMVPEVYAAHTNLGGWHFVLYSQIRLSRTEGNRYRAVWFGFADLYDGLGRPRSTDEGFGVSPRLKRIIPCEQYPETIPRSNWQRNFGYSFYHQEGLLQAGCQCADEFPNLFLTDLLKADLDCLDWMVLQDLDVREPVSRLFDLGSDSQDVKPGSRALRFRVVRRRKAEDVHKAVKHLKASNIPNSVSAARQLFLQSAACELAISSQTTLAHAQRADFEAEQKSTQYSREEQSRQASRMSALTYCAALFLPLSLSASLLGMESRARDLGLVLYDFLGLACIFISVAVGVTVISRWTLVSISERKLSLVKELPSRYLWILSIANRVIITVCWVILLTSFFIGMTSSIGRAKAVGLFISYICWGYGGAVGLGSGIVLLARWLMFTKQERARKGEASSV